MSVNRHASDTEELKKNEYFELFFRCVKVKFLFY